ncbi:unnamed protein product [Acanthoscelides obtectus]|uniref:PLAT domain-containing protein n=1 Tax=Acanthoscelides obtectus TaxID=200917 RepID=A0A9P0JN23_ACAOB|nr:unnamed protein product [Acanthoscelides obtectus]CAK1661116.1 Location of vulva defective 1 [Acanthoscelides obtectus]
MITEGYDLSLMPFILGANTKIQVRVIDRHEFKGSTVMDVQVESSLKDKTADGLQKEVDDKFFNDKSPDSIENLIEHGNYEKALQTINVLVDDMEQLRDDTTKDVIFGNHQRIYDALQNIPVKADTADTIAAISNKIAKAYIDMPDINVIENATTLCEKSAQAGLNEIKKLQFPAKYEEDIRRSTKLLAECSQAGANSNEALLVSEAKVVIPTTEFPLIDKELIVENYPDYSDDQNTSRHLRTLEDSFRRMENICYLTAKTLAMTMSIEERPKAVDAGHYKVVACKKVGEGHRKAKLVSQNIELASSPDFLYTKDAVDILMCTSSKNILWWAQIEKPSSNIALVRFDVEERAVEKFSNPYRLTFFMFKNASSILETYSGRTPQAIECTQKRDWCDYERIAQYRIDVFGSRTYIIQFNNLDEESTLLVLISRFEKPPASYFSLAEVITKYNATIYKTNDDKYDAWDYLYILPGAEEKEYNFSVFTLSCQKWDYAAREWRHGCSSDAKRSSVNRIVCRCFQASIFSGKVTNNEVQPQHTSFTEFELEYQANYIIFLFLLAIYTTYCVLLIYFSMLGRKKRIWETIYFLPDTSYECRYGYLIIVRTADKKSAGTTSNVVIQIRGKQNKSQEHLLNYPDPELSMLQKNCEDWFFLATEKYLGEVGSIQIWFDALGYRPAWYCISLELVDLQTNKYWYFNIDTWFRMSGNQRFECTAYPTHHMEGSLKQQRISKLISKMRYGTHMWNIFEDKDVLTMVKRITIIFSIICTIFTTIMLAYGCPKLRLSDSISYYSRYTINWYSFLATCCGFTITYLIHYPTVYYMRKQANDEDYIFHIGGSRIGLGSILSYFLIVLIVTNMTLLVIFGFWVTHITGLMWLTCVLGSMLVYIFVLENTSRFVHNLLDNMKKRMRYIFQNFRSIALQVEGQRKEVFRRFGKNGLRPYLGHLYSPLNDSLVTERRTKANLKLKVIELLEDLIMIAIYVVLLYTVILRDKNPLSHYYHNQIKYLVTGATTRTEYVEDTRGSITGYLKSTLLMALQSKQWYGRYVVDSPGMTVDQANKYIGVARLRQHRSVQDKCPEYFNKSVDEIDCVGYFFGMGEKRWFDVGWTPLAEKYRNGILGRQDPVWRYQSALKAGTVAYVGLMGTYPGGGYIAPMGRTIQNSFVNLQYLQRNHWIDNLTRCMFVEFLLYNANANLFGQVQSKYEVSLSGIVYETQDIRVASLLVVKSKESTVTVVASLCFIIMVVILGLKLVIKVATKRRIALKDMWLLIDLVIVLMSIACLFLYVGRTKLVKQFLRKVEDAKHNEFINYFHLFYTESTLTIMAAVLIFVATLRLWKLLRFFQIIQVVERTLIYSMRVLWCLFLCHMIIIILFMFTGQLIKGQNTNARGVIETVAVMSLMSFGFVFDPDLVEDYKLYYATFQLYSTIYSTVVVAVISTAYADAQLYYSDEKHEYSVQEYIRDEIRYYFEVIWIKWKRLRLTGGEDTEDDDARKVVTPKSDEFRFSECLTAPVSRLTTMLHLSLCVLRNISKHATYFGAKDVATIRNAIAYYFGSDSQEKAIFYEGRTVTGQVKLVDDRLFQRMENICNDFDEEPQNQHNQQLQGVRSRRAKEAAVIEKYNNKIDSVHDKLKFLLEAMSNIKIDGE